MRLDLLEKAQVSSLRKILMLLLSLLVAGMAKAETFRIDDVALSDRQQVLPSANSFRPVAGRPYWEGLDRGGQVVGWLVLSTDVVSIKGYSGKPLVTLVGLDTKGVIGGARVIHHSEPIILLGIPEQSLTDFVDFYAGKRADVKISVGRSDDPDILAVDGVSGATVTVLSENATILDSARSLGMAVGILKQAVRWPGEFVASDRDWTFKQMMKKGVFGHLLVTEQQLGISEQDTAFVDLYYTLADAPQVGRPLLGENTYRYLKGMLKDDEHLAVILGNGSGSFKGSGFVRGGIFDRVRLEQKLSSCMFTDHDYFNLPVLAVEDAPAFKEGAVFITRGAVIDPGGSFDLIFLGSFYDKKGAFSREFRSFSSSHQLPRSVYKHRGPSPDSLIWRQTWATHKIEIFVLGAFWLFIVGLFVQRSWMSGSMLRLHRVQTACLLFSFLVLGLWMSAQPSITQVLTFIGAVVHDWDMNLFLSEPLLFISWIFIIGVLFIWGRGVFCGWVCPFGALSQLLHSAGKRLGVKSFELPPQWHKRVIYLRYLVVAGLIPAYLISPELGEKLAEVEPFKTTFFLVPWERHWGFFSWWLLLMLVSVFWFRPFCRYLCPLGATLALPTFFRRSGPYRRKFCKTCKVCFKNCEYKAIRPDGTIRPTECMNCMDCEANYRSDTVCPPLFELKNLKPGPETASRRARLEKFKERV